jgi:hypothetical protein
MAQVPILSGIYTSNGPDYRVSLPVNLVPVALPNGASAGYLRPAEGIVDVGTGVGLTRGMIYWEGAIHAVQGTSLVRIASDGTVTTLGTIADGGPVRFTYSFDQLAVASGGRLYYWDGSSLDEVTDTDLGVCRDVVWIAGFFMSTDGTDIVVTELNDPMSVNINKYASNEANPDPVVGLLRLRNEVYSFNRYTIEVFDLVGGTGFPFAVIEGAQVQKGSLGTFAACVYGDVVAFVGSGFNEAPGVYLAQNGTAVKLSTVEIDRILASYSEVQLADTVCESRIFNGHEHLYVHLPDRTLVFDRVATQALGQQVWFVLSSGLVGYEQYRARYFTFAYDRWWAGDPTTDSFGTLDESIGTIYGDARRWEFATAMVYNEGKSVTVKALELVALTGRVALGADPRISTSYSLDGMTWSLPKYINAGTIGERGKRLTWFRQGGFRDQRFQRFQGTSDAHISVARLEAEFEGGAY